MAGEIDPQLLQMYSLALQDPERFKMEFGGAGRDFDSEEAALEKRKALVRALTEQSLAQPSSYVHQTGEGGMFGALASTFGGARNAMAQHRQDSELGDIANQQKALMGQRQAAIPMGERLMQARKALENQRETEAAKSRIGPGGYMQTVDKDGNVILVHSRTGEAIQPSLNGAPVVSATKPKMDMERERLEEQKRERETKRTEKARDVETDLRNEFGSSDAVKGAESVARSFSAIRGVGQATPSAANDQALIFSFMKLLDDGSVVRETEFENAKKAGGLYDKLKAALGQVEGGTLLSAGMRADFLQAAERLQGSYGERYEARKKEYQRIAKEYGAKPQNVTPNVGLGSDAPASQGGLDAKNKALLEELRRKKAAGEF